MIGTPPPHGTRERGPWPPSDDELAERALRVALRTASAILGNREQARDIAQDVAIDVLRGVRSLHAPETLDAWIHRIAVRHTMRALKRRRRRTESEMSLAELPEVLEPAGGESPFERVERRESARELAEALGQLPAKQSMALVLRYVHDMTHEQIAEAMGVRSGTAGSLISRGRAALRERGAFAPAEAFDRGEGA